MTESKMTQGKPQATAVLDTLADLIRINSVNPNYDGGVPEREIADFIENYFQQRQIETWRQHVYDDRPNVIARLPGRDSSRRIVLEAHMDTVSVTGMEIAPWDPVVRGGKMYGRGSCDTKAGMAAMMRAVSSLADDAIVPPCDVLFAATIDEEYSYRGVVAFCQAMNAAGTALQADAAIVAEPTGLQSVIASKGLVRWKIETRGKASHSSKPHLGVNAIDQMAHLITALQHDTRRLSVHSHPLLGPATCNVGVIRGGVQVNFVPDRCEIEIDRRMLPGEDCDSVLDHYQDLIETLATEHQDFDAVMHPPMLTDRPLETPSHASAVAVMSHVLQQLGYDPTPIGVPFCSDASKFGAIGIPSMILGPGSIDQAHAAVEFVDCEQVLQAAEIYRNFVLAFDPFTGESS